MGGGGGGGGGGHHVLTIINELEVSLLAQCLPGIFVTDNLSETILVVNIIAKVMTPGISTECQTVVASPSLLYSVS